MAKKNMMESNAIRTMALGIATVMALGEPMSVLAEENGENENNIQVNNEENSVVKEAQTAADKADAAISKADGSAEAVKKDIEDSVLESDTKGNEAKDLLEEIEDDAEISTKNDGSSDTSVIDEKMDDVDVQLGIAEAADTVVEKQLQDAEAAVNDAENAAEDAADLVEEAAGAVAEDLENIENATTEEEANAAYAEMEAEVEQARINFDEKVAEYNTAKTAYEDAARNAEAAREIYENAVESAEGDAAAAEAALETAQREADELAQKVDEAKKAVDSASAAAMDIAAKEKLTQEDKGLNWRNEDQLFESIMINYYLPETLGIKDAGATVKRKQGKDNDDYNYFEVVYQKDGQQVTEYYNYKMDNNNTDQDKIVIFEKREVEIFGDSSKDSDIYTDSDGNKWIVNEEAGKEGDKKLDEALKDGTVVEVNGTYYEKNEKTGESILIENSESTQTSTEDITISGTRSETYKEEVDEQGNVTGIVKEITADVTTITYTEKTFHSKTAYDTAAERDAAAEAKESELEAATGKDATVVKTTKESYVAEGTYVPVFERTIDINRKILSASGASVIASVEEDVREETRQELEDYYIIEQTFEDMNKHNTGEYLEGYPFDEYEVTGKSTVTFAKTTKQKISFNIIQGLLDIFTGELSGIANQWVKENGGIYVGSTWVDGDGRTAEITYVAAETIKGEAAASEEEARKSLESAIMKALETLSQAEGKKAVAQNKEVDVEHQTTYSYDVNYLEKASEETGKKVIAKETYGNADALTGEILQNLNYLNNHILMDQNDEKYRDFVDSAKELTSKYERLLKEAQTAQKDVEAARSAVDALQEEIEALKNKGADTNGLAELESRLRTAEAKLAEAEGNMENLEEQLEAASDVLQEVIESLRPAGGEENGDSDGSDNSDGVDDSDGNGGSDGNNESDGNGGSDGSGESDGNGGSDGSSDSDGNGGSDGNNESDGNAGSDGSSESDGNGGSDGSSDSDGNGGSDGNNESDGNGGSDGNGDSEEDDVSEEDGNSEEEEAPEQNGATSVENNVPTATTAGLNTPGEGVPAAAPAGNAENAQGGQTETTTVVIEDEQVPMSDNTALENNTETETEKTPAVIEDEDVPLSDGISEEKEKMSWWWLLIIAVLGVTGYEMYKKHQEKKKDVE